MDDENRGCVESQQIETKDTSGTPKVANYFKGIWRKLSLIVIGLFAGLLIAECGLRLLGISFPIFDAYDYLRAVKLKPGKEGWYRKEGNAFISINSLGYRDIEHLEEKSSGVFRIAVLGDSFTEARQVDIKAVFWKRLEKSLKFAAQAEGKRIEVLSFGVGGYGTTQELLTLRLHALRFSPDLVLLAFYTGNDLLNNSKKLSMDTNDVFRPFYNYREGELVLENPFRDWSLANLRTRFLLSATHHFRILELINQGRRWLEVRRRQNSTGRWEKGNSMYSIGINHCVFVPPKDRVWEEVWILTEALIEEMNRTVGATGARFALIAVNAPIQAYPDKELRKDVARRLGVEDLFYPDRRLAVLGDRLGIPVIRLAPQFQEIADKKGVYLHGFENTVLGYGHWNEEGHRLAAEIISARLLASGMIP